MTDLSLDIESMGQRPGAAIVGIGACFFDVTTGQIDEGFYVPVHLATCTAHGMTIDASTVLWWLGQGDEVRNAIRFGAYPITNALQMLTDYIRQRCPIESVRPWMRGPSFDASLLRYAYDAVQMDLPWCYWNERCHRTLTARNPSVEEPTREGAWHNALEDAKHQARWLIKIAEAQRARIRG
jgi:hypothetical protein